MTLRNWVHAFNHATPEQIARAMEKLDTETLEWAVRFEGLASTDSRDAADSKNEGKAE